MHQLGEVAEEPGARRTQLSNVIPMLDLTDQEALVTILREYRGNVKPGVDEEPDEAVLKAISKKTGYSLVQIMDAFAPILEDEMGIQKLETLFRLMETINENRLQLLVNEFNRLQSDKPEMTPLAILTSIEMKEREGYWREGELQRTYDFALRRGKIVVGES